jgi:hypothetical protein
LASAPASLEKPPLKLIRGPHSPPAPELRHIFGSFAELRARIEARRGAGERVIGRDIREVNPESLPRVEEDCEP